MSAALSSLGARLQTSFPPPIPHFCMINREIWWLWCIYHLLVEQWEKRSGFHGAPLLVFMEGCSGHLSCCSPLASPGAVGSVCPVTASPMEAFGGLLEVVGSVPSSLSWQLHLDPVPAAGLDFGAELWTPQRRRRRKCLFNS